MLSTLGQAPAEIRGGRPWFWKSHEPPVGSEWGAGAQRTPWAPTGGGERGGGGRGSRAPLTWPQRLAYLARPGPVSPDPGWGRQCSERPGPQMRPVVARNSPALATAPPPPVSQARPLRCAAQGCGGGLATPHLLPFAVQSEEADARGGAVATRAVRAGGGTRRVRRSDRSAARRKQPRPLRRGAAAGQLGGCQHAGRPEDFPSPPGRLGVRGR